jgi:predicted RNA-binding Zn-ribbon protein involved in translation (DUF1610 family)
MYCYHCGKKIDEHKLEKQRSSIEAGKGQADENTKVSYVCPRCGYLIHEGQTEQDLKSLSAAAHAEIQRGNNFFAIGMGNASIGSICLILAFVFFRLSFKPGQNNRLDRSCPEYFVFWILLAVGIILFAWGVTYVVIGQLKKRKYQHLLKDIQTNTFFQ